MGSCVLWRQNYIPNIKITFLNHNYDATGVALFAKVDSESKLTANAPIRVVFILVL